MVAIRNGTPIVMIESTIISHGVPFPQKLGTRPMRIQRRRGAGRGGGSCSAELGL